MRYMQSFPNLQITTKTEFRKEKYPADAVIIRIYR